MRSRPTVPLAHGRGQRGQAIVELAGVLLVVALIVAAVVSAGLPRFRVGSPSSWLP